MSNDERFTSEELKRLHDLAGSHGAELLAMLEDYRRSRWLARLAWKIIITVGATTAGVVAFKDHVVSLFNFKGT